MAVFKRFVFFIFMMPALIYAMPGPGKYDDNPDEVVEEFLCCVALNGEAKKLCRWEVLENTEDMVFRSFKLTEEINDDTSKLMGVMAEFSKCSVCHSFCWPLPSECEGCHTRVCKKCLISNKKKCAGSCQKKTYHQAAHIAESVFLLTAETLGIKPGEHIRGQCQSCSAQVFLSDFSDHTKQCFVSALPFSHRLETLKSSSFDDEWKEVIAASGLSLIDGALKCVHPNCKFKQDVAVFKDASSVKSVGHFWLRQFTKRVIQGYFRTPESSKTVCFSRSHFYFGV